ncbi:unnamed protein product [Effrenium voratum]|uniref:Uncharacterized protein n=1 Tax=Effrenium voratum TaxID=2562239 RepID=A0AA36NLQ7_9DINO|nr:unnamed protein product [Effrenium voratum]
MWRCGLVAAQFVGSQGQIFLTDSELAAEAGPLPDESEWLQKGLDYVDHPGLSKDAKAYLAGTAPGVEQWDGGEDWEQWLTEAMEKLPTGVEVDDHQGTPIGEGESIALVAAEMEMIPDQLSKLPEAFQSGLFTPCPSEGCPKWPVMLRMSHTQAVGVDLLRYALKIGAEKGETIDLTFTETLNAFPIGTKDQLKAFAFGVKYGQAAALLRYPLEMGQVTLNGLKTAFKYKSASQVYAAVSKDYYSLTPWRIGGGGNGETPGAFKYRLTAAMAREKFPAEKEIKSKGFKQAMRDQAVGHLSEKAWTYNFEIQVATDPKKHSIDDAADEWDEASAPWIKMGRLVIPKQSFQSPVTTGNAVGQGLWQGQQQAAFNSKEFLFSPAMSPHAPLGAINAFRADLYPSYDEARQKHLLGKSGKPRQCPFKETSLPGCAER